MANASTSGTGPQPAGLAQGVIATVVGGGNHVDIPADRLAAQVMLGHASRPAVDKDGNLYYPDQLRHWVCKVTPQGAVTTVAGTGAAGYTPDGGPAAAAKLNFPEGVAVDDAGNVYIADQLNHMVRKVSTAGVISRVDAPQIRVPADVAVDADGSLYIAEYGGHRISKVDAKGVVTTIAGNGQAGFAGDGGPATAARINSPIGVAVDGGGNVYIAEYAGHRVRKVAPDGVITTVAGDGIAGYAGDGGPATAARLYSPGGVVLDRTGNLYIADTDNARIRGVTSAATTGSAWQDTPLRVTQTNVPRAFPDQPTVFNLEIHSLSNQPVNPGTIEQRFTAPTGFAFTGTASYGYHYVRPAAAGTLDTHLEDDGRTLVALFNPHVNTGSTDRNVLIYTIGIRALPDAQPGTYDDGTIAVGGLLVLPLTATVD
ncbi:hypothetical protein [Kitasatospora sp. NBC_01300]|uniref:NHL domain-containing protein n=1 Tax=Kitasatospora sp. NBC_01300 TaxID=2903574 RepID=UPI002F9180B9|nr:hypothetical protein OG556_35060 [Kitasatospora sp. NBC_01300]